MIQRTFHPIGQGAFYSERHANYNIVYDCGNWKKTNLASMVVQQSFKSSESIDILFISHFDADHINKIEVLKNHCRHIHNVVLPLLHENEKRVLINFYISLGKPEAASIVDNPKDFFGDETNLIFVEPSENLEGDVEDFDIENHKEPVNGENFTISSNTKIYSRAANWFYLPFNYNYTARKLELEQLFIAKGLNITLFQNDLNYALLHKNKVKAIYNSITGQINQNSMIVYSGPVENNYNNIRSYHNDWLFMSDYNRSGCIFSGDADFNTVDIRVVFNRFWDKVGTIQIPHHGDLKCFNSNFFDGRFYYCPMSVGNTNTYGHPSTSVFSAILVNNSYPIKVTESLNSGFFQIIFN